jgi:hypothetical protein
MKKSVLIKVIKSYTIEVDTSNAYFEKDYDSEIEKLCVDIVNQEPPSYPVTIGIANILEEVDSLEMYIFK